MSSNLVDLTEIVETWAWDSFRKTHVGKQMKPENIIFDINWSRVSSVPSTPKFAVIGNVEPTSSIIFKSVFRNDTNRDQTHTLKTERQTTATCTASLTKGYTKGFNVGLTLASPLDVAQASVGFERGFSIENASNSTDQKTLTWTAEGSLIVPAKSSMTTELEVVENQHNYKFTTTVALTGTITVAILNKNENSNFVMSVSGGIAEVLKGDNTVKRGNTAYMNFEGTCSFKYGIEQKVRVYPSMKNEF